MRIPRAGWPGARSSRRRSRWSHRSRRGRRLGVLLLLAELDAVKCVRGPKWVYSLTKASPTTATSTASTSGAPGAAARRARAGRRPARATRHGCASRAAPRRGGAHRRSVAAPKRNVEERDHQQVARREGRQERRGEPAKDLAPARVVDEVLRQPGEVRVAQTELILEPVGGAVVAPPGQRHEIDVGEAVGGDPAAVSSTVRQSRERSSAVSSSPRPRRYAATGSRSWRAAKDHPTVRRAPPSHDCGRSP